jgi:serine/threonine-protein phosphatase 2A regulatory subunit B
MSSDPLEWKFVQSFGDDNSSDDDLVTAVEFDDTGDYLAVGDKAGRICIFESQDAASRSKAAADEESSGNNTNINNKPSPQSALRSHPLEYKFYTEFQSHEPEFDCLKSLEIEEKINMIKWQKSKQNNGLYLLATNDKTIKYCELKN